MSEVPRSFPLRLLRALLADEVERLAAWKRIRAPPVASQSSITRLVTRSAPARGGLRGGGSVRNAPATGADTPRGTVAVCMRDKEDNAEEEVGTSSSDDDEQEEDGRQEGPLPRSRTGRAFRLFARGKKLRPGTSDERTARSAPGGLVKNGHSASAAHRSAPGPLLAQLPVVGRLFGNMWKNERPSPAKKYRKRESRAGKRPKNSASEKMECRGKGEGRANPSLDALLHGADLPLIAAATQRFQWPPEILRKRWEWQLKRQGNLFVTAFLRTLLSNATPHGCAAVRGVCPPTRSSTIPPCLLPVCSSHLPYIWPPSKPPHA